jgi:hypothetical protein
MNKINIEPTEKTPAILFDPEEGIFEMKGNSRPEDVRIFYYPVMDALRTYYEQITKHDLGDKPFKAVFEMHYFNTSSTKFIADILLLLKKFTDKNINLSIHWYYDKDDDDMKEVGTELSEMIQYDFEFFENKEHH